jgi:Divergent InlB B-repeat domain
VRRHAKATSSGPNERKPSGPGSGTSSGPLRLTLLLATVAAFMLVPAAQALAHATMKVNMAGSGQGEVNSGALGPFSSVTEFKGSPPIECTYASPGPAAGVCNNEFLEVAVFGNTEVMFLRAKAAEGSEFTGWTLTKGKDMTEGEEGGTCASGAQTAEENEYEEAGLVEPGERACLIRPVAGEGEVTAVFKSTGPSGPTNLRTLTVKKAGPANSAGTVKSKPKGVNCASACSEATASYYKNTSVTLEGKPATGSSFTGWSGGGCSGTGTCVVSMTEAQEVTATFAPVGLGSKEILNPVSLTLTKAGSGYGTVKATGLACEVLCTSTVVSYTSGGGPKAKPAAIVTLEAVSAPGSQTVAWTGCESEPGGKCVVTMSAAKEVTATFNELE